MLYQGSLFTGRGEFIEHRTFGTMAALESWARPHLPTISATAATKHRDMSRAPSVSVAVGRGADLKMLDGKRCGSKKSVGKVEKFWLEPECVIVPSVGELGYW